ncbi:rcc1 domain containing protein [Dermatophagoides farinae]|uniref:Rcc1 domain containing protein n=1 Tax=Dermatophagoides farinae TaxID=6954 RepID=A0A9D4NTZ7_DERFA|nr:rcc1 domain containing protein [Dermatophagoides farinae]
MTLERRKLRRSIPILNDLDSYLYQDIKRVFVFGRNSDCVIFITNNDHVYSYGRNNCGCLGIGNDYDNQDLIVEPQKIHRLCGRKIVEFSAGRNHILARSKNGKIFACGSNEFGQLALPLDDYAGSSINIPQQIQSLRNEHIIGIACGAFHSLALTKRGIIYGWGFNFWGQLGLGDNHNRFAPTILRQLQHENIVEIACGQHHSVALSRKGHLFTWGHNAYGQLGIGERINYRNIPTKVIDGNDFIIKQVTCGQNHVLAVSVDGQLLGFGSNYYGQLGTGSRRNESLPVRICLDEKINDILASPFSNTSLARTKKKRNSLVFGKCGDHWLLTPIDTKIIDDNDESINHHRKQQQSSSNSSNSIISLDENNNPLLLRTNFLLEQQKSPTMKKNKSNSHEIFANINQSTAHTTKVVRSNYHHHQNLFWQILYLMKSKLPKIKQRSTTTTTKTFDNDDDHMDQTSGHLNQNRKHFSNGMNKLLNHHRI